jgi:hypothetical protein
MIVFAYPDNNLSGRSLAKLRNEGKSWRRIAPSAEGDNAPSPHRDESPKLRGLNPNHVEDPHMGQLAFGDQLVQQIDLDLVRLKGY